MTRPIESDYTSQVAYTRALEAYCDSLPQLDRPAQPEPVELLKLVIEEAEITWLAAEASIAAALLAAEKAYKTCLDVRCHWKREEGTDMCELAVLAIAISQANPNLEQIHFIDKDIVTFHTLFWPAMLHFSGRK